VWQNGQKLYSVRRAIIVSRPCIALPKYPTPASIPPCPTLGSSDCQAGDSRLGMCHLYSFTPINSHGQKMMSSSEHSIRHYTAIWMQNIAIESWTYKVYSINVAANGLLSKKCLIYYNCERFKNRSGVSLSFLFVVVLYFGLLFFADGGHSFFQ
jgi:hypothetical protein